MSDCLEKFFVVTKNSLYEVVAPESGPAPVAKRIKEHSPNKDMPIGAVITYPNVSICKWLQFYIPERYGFMHPMTGVEREIAQVNTAYWGGRTSGIVALFLNENDAETCFESSDLELCDPRWLENTKEVVKRIGNEHPTVTVSNWSGLRLLDCEAA
jgi:hypothetical protein